MYNSVKIISVITFLLMFFSCGSISGTSQNYERKWMLVEFKDYTKEFLTKHKAYLDLSSRNNDHQYSAKMGCNNMFLTAKFRGNTVSFSGIGSTMMYCDGVMQLEDDFSKALPLIKKYSVDGHYLTLTDGAGKMMKFVAADWD